MWLEPSSIVRWVACAVLLACMTAPAVAAKVYRCGNVFQDQPCSSDKDEGRPAARSTAAREATTPVATAKTSAPVIATSATARLLPEAPRGVAIEARR